VKVIEQKEHKGDVIHFIYDSVGDFFENTDPTKTYNCHSGNKSDQKEILNGDRDWRFGEDRSRSVFYENRFDPMNGKKMCESEVKKVLSSKEYKKLIQQALTYKKKITFEDLGFRLNVARAISGDDKYFVKYKNAKRPTVKIAINICGSACVDEDAFRKVAMTAVPTIYALELAGIATEVYYTAFATGTHSDDFEHSCTHVKIKSAQQRFNWTTFAPIFCLGSYRESVFMSWVSSQYEVSNGLGRPMNERDISNYDNFGYSAVIGLNAVGAVDQVQELFIKIKN
jgi:hypothetical protein